MKTVGQVLRKLKQIRFRHLKRELNDQLSQRSCNCAYNVTLPPQGHDGYTPYALCAYGSSELQDWEPSYCDDAMDDGLRSSSCPLFRVRRTRDQVQEDFQRSLSSKSLPEVARYYPDMAALLWVLDESDFSDTTLATISEPEDEELPPVVSDVPPINMPVRSEVETSSEVPPLEVASKAPDPVPHTSTSWIWNILRLSGR